MSNPSRREAGGLVFIISARPLANSPLDRLQSSRGRKNVRSAALKMRACSQAMERNDAIPLLFARTGITISVFVLLRYLGNLDFDIES